MILNAVSFIRLQFTDGLGNRCNDNMTCRHFASTRYYGNNPLLSVLCVLCVIAQRFSIQPLGSLLSKTQTPGFGWLTLSYRSLS